MKPTVFVLAFLSALSASATWTLSTEDVPSGCSHVITDGNWKIGVYRYADDNWRLGGGVNQNGAKYIAGSGVLDLRSLETDCGVVLKTTSNGGLERITTITEVWFPDSLEEMDGGTFNSDNTGSTTTLTNVVFGTGIRRIGPNAFNNCQQLQSVNFPEGLVSIEQQAFANCKSLVLQAGGFPDSLVTIGEKAFQNCTKLITGRLDLKNVSKLTGVAQFEGDTGITEVYAPHVTSIPNYMFNKCSGLTKAEFPADLSFIGEHAFNNGGNLVSFFPTVLPRLTAIGHSAFRGQKKLVASFDFSKSSLTTIPTYALVDLHKVSELKFPETLTSLASESLAHNSGLSRVVWFMGPPPTMTANSMWSGSTSAQWILVAGKKHAAEWKASEYLLEFGAGDRAKAETAVENCGLTGVKLIGKWQNGANGATYWVVEELPKGLAIYIM